MRALVALGLAIGVSGALMSDASRAAVTGPGTLVFFSQRTLGGGLYAESASGGPLRLLVTGTPESSVVWSPDGSRFLFQRDGTPVWEPELWISNVDGTHVRKLAVVAGQPSWAPDGKHIAFVRNGAIWIMRAGGGGHRLTRPGGGSDNAPRWSPDGRLIAFLRAPPPGGPVASALMAVRPDGTGLRRIAARVFFPPSWAPDGRRIAFDSSGPTDVGPFQPSLYVASPHGAQRRRLTDSQQGSGFVAWSPNGRWIALTDFDGRYVSIVRPDGTAVHRLFDADYASSPAWSPDSTRLAIAVGAPTDVWVVDLGGHARQITAGSRYGYGSYEPSWQPRSLPPARLGGTVVSPELPTDSVVVDGVLETTRPIAAIAADGDRVAIAFGPGAAGGPGSPVGCLETWEPRTGSIVRFTECGLWVSAPQAPALAGDQLVLPSFAHVFGTNFYGIQTATVDHPGPGWIAGLCANDGTCNRDPVGDVVGWGSLLVFDSWKGPEPYCNDPCPPPKRDGRLFRIDNGAAVQIAASATELTPLAVDNGRILVDEGGGTLAILDETGAPLLTVADPGTTEASLDGHDLVAHNGAHLDVYDATSGAAVHSWPLPAATATLAGVDNGLALYVAGDVAHLLRLTDGTDVALPALGSDLHARLTPAGVFESYTVADARYPGRVTLVPVGATH